MGQMLYNASPICSIMRLQFVYVSENSNDFCPFYRYIGAFCTGNRVVGNVLRISVHSLSNNRPQIVAWGRFWRILIKILVENGRHSLGFIGNPLGQISLVRPLVRVNECCCLVVCGCAIVKTAPGCTRSAPRQNSAWLCVVLTFAKQRTDRQLNGERSLPHAGTRTCSWTRTSAPCG